MPVSPPSGTRIWVPVSLTHSQEERAELQSSLCKTGVPTLAPPRKDPRDSEVLGVSTLGSGWGARETSGRSPRAKEEPPSPGVQEQEPLVEQSRRRPQDPPGASSPISRTCSHLLPSRRQEAGGGQRVHTAPRASHPEPFAPSIAPRALLSAGKSDQKVAGSTRPRTTALRRVWPWDKIAGNAVLTHHLKRKPEHRSTGGRGGKEAG